MSPQQGGGTSALRPDHRASRPLRRPQHFRRVRAGRTSRRFIAAALPLTVLAAAPTVPAGAAALQPATHHVAMRTTASRTPTHHPAPQPSAVASDSPLIETMSALRVNSATHHADRRAPSVEAFGTAESRRGPSLPADAVGVAVARNGTGYWVVDTSGKVVAHGAAHNYGSLHPRDHAGRIVGIAAAPDGRGYWLVSADGGVYPFGDATFEGSPNSEGLRHHAPIVGIAATGSGQGYWLVTAAGGVHPFGDATFEGSPNSEGLRHHAPIVGIAATGRHGYWIAAANGSVYEYGDAPFEGSLPSRHRHAHVTGITATPSGRGYWLVAGDGRLFPFGNAGFAGSAAPEPSSAVVTAVAATGRDGYFELSASAASLRAADARAAHAHHHVRHRRATSHAVALGDFLVTCYDLRGTTASGAPVSTATVAVDPSVIPMGAEIDIAGVGVRVAQDTGGAIIGHHIDVWEPSYQACMDWGARYESVTLLRR